MRLEGVETKSVMLYDVVCVNDVPFLKMESSWIVTSILNSVLERSHASSLSCAGDHGIFGYPKPALQACKTPSSVFEWRKARGD